MERLFPQKQRRCFDSIAMTRSQSRAEWARHTWALRKQGGVQCSMSRLRSKTPYLFLRETGFTLGAIKCVLRKLLGPARAQM